MTKLDKLWEEFEVSTLGSKMIKEADENTRKGILTLLKVSFYSGALCELKVITNELTEDSRGIAKSELDTFGGLVSLLGKEASDTAMSSLDELVSIAKKSK